VVPAIRQISTLMNEQAAELQLIHACHLLRLLLGELFCVNPRYALPERPPRHPSIETALNYMQSKVNEALSLAEIARRAGLSVSYFCGLFGQQMGISPMDYLIQLKLRRARRLLVTTSLTVQEVAHKVGYDDAYYFSRLFRKLHGVPPVAYRREHALAA
jgi:transcriptional regulator GlxA family with amidase domain